MFVCDRCKTYPSCLMPSACISCLSLHHMWGCGYSELKQNLVFLMLFEAVLLWVLVHPQYLSTLLFLMLFKAFLWQVLVHPLYYTSLYTSGNLLQALFHRLSPYQQTQGFLVLFWLVILVHRLSHLSLYQHALGTLVIFEAVRSF